MPDTIPAQIGPCRIERRPHPGHRLPDRVRCCDARRADADWDRGNRQWVLSDMRRLSPVLRAFRTRTDPLFRSAGFDLDMSPP
jgi:hypothetical protein